jgi:GNAT superfamily N-acetyltransferase
MCATPSGTGISPGNQASSSTDDTHWIDHLVDGTAVLIRPLCADDRERGEDFLRALSPQARHFLCDVGTDHAALARRPAESGAVQHQTFIALAHENGQLRSVGLSRYSAAAGPDCRCAVVVADDWRHRGLAMLMMSHLVEMVRARGFHRMFLAGTAEHPPVQELVVGLGFEPSPAPEGVARTVYTLEL